MSPEFVLPRQAIYTRGRDFTYCVRQENAPWLKYHFRETHSVCRVTAGTYSKFYLASEFNKIIRREFNFTTRTVIL